jgi:hypothetical protein
MGHDVSSSTSYESCGGEDAKTAHFDVVVRSGLRLDLVFRGLMYEIEVFEVFLKIRNTGE